MDHQCFDNPSEEHVAICFSRSETLVHQSGVGHPCPPTLKDEFKYAYGPHLKWIVTATEGTPLIRYMDIFVNYGSVWIVLDRVKTGLTKAEQIRYELPYYNGSWNIMFHSGTGAVYNEHGLKDILIIRRNGGNIVHKQGRVVGTIRINKFTNNFYYNNW